MKNKIQQNAMVSYLTNQELVIQQLKQKPKCAFCGKYGGEVEICDKETLKTIMICEVCDEELFRISDDDFQQHLEELRNGLTAQQEDFILEQELEDWREARDVK